MSAEQTKFAVTRAGSGKGRVAVFVKRKYGEQVINWVVHDLTACQK